VVGEAGKTTGDEWRRYYENASRRRERVGGDPFLNYRRRVLTKRKWFLIMAAALLVGLFAASYALSLQ
jgi:hypothetical protein